MFLVTPSTSSKPPSPIKDELTRLHTEVAELRSRVATLEAERARAAADSIQSSF